VLRASVVRVENNRERNRFEIELGGQYAILVYSIAGSQIDLQHTEVPKEWRGQAIGERLVRSALDFARASDLKVIPSCPFVAAFIRKHAEYADLRAPTHPDVY
jgi:predicted GNAT family acetyltransferase